MYIDGSVCPHRENVFDSNIFTCCRICLYEKTQNEITRAELCAMMFNHTHNQNVMEVSL